MNKAYAIAANTSISRVNLGMDLPSAELSGAYLFFFTKRLIDVTVALVFILGFLPFYLILALLTFASSQGPAVFRQERVGKDGRKFTIYKFRSMYREAEKDGPMLAVPNDPRITRWGRFMRKYKLDETPQFFNVLEGSMSLVGPRPERAYFKDQLTRSFPHLDDLNKVKPGITSLGQIKFGYASNVEQMRKRARYDVLYLKNLSLKTDLKIVGLTFIHIFFGERSFNRLHE
jgi:lipopolysaccharide/colanic/teichoic acid biosynthesis glycosyltransferase